MFNQLKIKFLLVYFSIEMVKTLIISNNPVSPNSSDYLRLLI